MKTTYYTCIMKSKTRIYTVIVGDLVGSRSISGREVVSHRIKSIIDRINEDFKKEFYAPLTLTLGMDELSGVLKRENMSYRICRLINEQVHPYLFRFAIAKGAVDVGVSSKDARKMDGPAFHTSASMIQHAKRENLYYCFNLGSRDKELDSLLNGLANILHLLRSSWTEHQRHVVELYEKLQSQKAVARKMEITQQAVSDALIQAHWKELNRAEITIDEILSGKNLNKFRNLYLRKQTKTLVK